MSTIKDPPEEGGGFVDPSEGDGPTGASAEHRQDEGHAEDAGASGKAGGDAPKTASKGINPVQHSE